MMVKQKFAVGGFMTDNIKTDLVVFFNRRLEHAMSFGIGQSIVERAIYDFVNRAPAEISLGGRCLFVPIVVNVQNVVPYELLGATRNSCEKRTYVCF